MDVNLQLCAHLGLRRGRREGGKEGEIEGWRRARDRAVVRTNEETAPS